MEKLNKLHERVCKESLKVGDKVKVVRGFNKGEKGTVTKVVPDRGQGPSYDVKIGSMITLYDGFDLKKESLSEDVFGDAKKVDYQDKMSQKMFRKNYSDLDNKQKKEIDTFLKRQGIESLLGRNLKESSFDIQKFAKDVQVTNTFVTSWSKFKKELVKSIQETAKKQNIDVTINEVDEVGKYILLNLLR